MEKIKFNMAIATEDGQFSHTVEKEGVLAFDLFGYQWIAHESVQQGHGKAWEVSERITGCRIPVANPSDDLEEAIGVAKAYIEYKGEALTHEVMGKAKEIIQNGPQITSTDGIHTTESNQQV